jgi:hypothetical protein
VAYITSSGIRIARALDFSKTNFLLNSWVALLLLPPAKEG